MSAIDEIASLLEAMRSRKGEMQSFENVLSEISVAMREMVAIMEKPEADDDTLEIAAMDRIADSIRSLTLAAPQVNVTVQPAAVMPAQIVVMPSDDKPMTGWKLRITARDGNGSISEISFKPES